MSSPSRLRWRVALVDSCGAWPGAAGAACFGSEGLRTDPDPAPPDPTGHGSCIAALLGADCELLLAQVFSSRAPATAAAVAAALDWSIAQKAHLVHLSLGLAEDRPVLAAAVARALGAGCIIVASTPARGAPVFPAAYAGVLRATGDARCAPGDLSVLGPDLFGGCPRLERPGAGASAGASIGAAWVTRSIIRGVRLGRAALVAELTAHARHHGRERRAGRQCAM